MIVAKSNFPEFMSAPAGSLPDISTGFVSALDHLGVIEASGDDAAVFLHNQLTNDILGLEQGRIELAGYCSAKGRLIATLMVWRHTDRFFLALPAELLPGFMKRLQMFVLRSKVSLKDVTEAQLMIGAAGPPANDAPPVWQGTANERGMRVRVPDAGKLQRWLCVGPLEHVQQQWAEWVTTRPIAPSSIWRWSEIIAGLPQVVEATREQFVPQMINFELVGGVNFKKGCYPGQEVVARSQYLGKTKRRTLLALTDDVTACAGTEVFSASDPEQPCGMLVNAESGPDGRVACLVEMKLDARSSPVHLHSVSGPVLNFGELPYALNDAA
jgi:folate-binding protein YgfZ